MKQALRVLMVGATGKYARLVVPELLKRGVVIRALVLDAETANTARDEGVEKTMVGNLRDPQSLRSAAEGADGIFHLGPAFAPDEAEMGVAMVEAAKAAGVKKFVFSSVIHPSLSRMANHAAKQPVEAALYESGLDFTVLQPAMFMQTLDDSWAGIVQSGQFSLPFSKLAKVCYVDYRDVAEAAALALTEDTLSCGTFELCAAGMVSRIEIAALMSTALGRQIEAGEAAFDEWARAAHLPEGLVRDGLAAMNADYDKYGFPGGNALTLRSVLGREPRTLAEYIGELVSRPI